MLLVSYNYEKLILKFYLITHLRTTATQAAIILDEGRCFVGDLEPIEYLGGYESNDRLKKDWNRVMSNNPKIIYYAHANEKML